MLTRTLARKSNSVKNGLDRGHLRRHREATKLAFSKHNCIKFRPYYRLILTCHLTKHVKFFFKDFYPRKLSTGLISSAMENSKLKECRLNPVNWCRFNFSLVKVEFDLD